LERAKYSTTLKKKIGVITKTRPTMALWFGTARTAWRIPMFHRPFYDLGAVDGSLGPLANLEGKTSAYWPSLSSGFMATENRVIIPLRYINDDDRDPTPDEMNAAWTAKKIKSLARSRLRETFFPGRGLSQTPYAIDRPSKILCPISARQNPSQP
jgi:hypothetical protein